MTVNFFNGTLIGKSNGIGKKRLHSEKFLKKCIFINQEHIALQARKNSVVLPVLNKPLGIFVFAFLFNLYSIIYSNN